MKRHLRWIIPLLLIPVSFFGGVFLGNLVAAQSARESGNIALPLLVLLLGLVAFAGPPVAAGFTIAGAVRTFKNWRRAHGHFNKRERAERAATAVRQETARLSWERAKDLRDRLLDRETPAAISVWEVVPRTGEVAFFDLRANYARFYGQVVNQTGQTGLFVGHPAFVLAGLATAGVVNAAQRNAAIAAAATQWREYQPVRVVVTNQRLVCQVGGSWLSFDYATMSAVYPEVKEWSLVCQFESGVAPLMLVGEDAPIAWIVTILMTHGIDGLRDHPSFAPLNGVRSDEATAEALEG